MSRVLLACVLLLGCAESLADHIPLQPAAESVEFAAEPPSAHSYKCLGPVTGVAAAKELDVAQQAARNDLRNKTAALGGSLVTVDQNLAEPLPLTDKMKVRLIGRAYKPIE
jgi:hypothetical protein